MKTQQDTRPLELLVQRAVTLLWVNRPKDGSPYIGAFSGGKDSIVIKELAEMAKVPVEWHYHMTTIDPPELVRFIREKHPDVIWDRPKQNLFTRARVKGFPTRTARWCCEEFKERTFPGRSMIVGVRIIESKGRAKRWTECTMTQPKRNMSFVLPIRLWPDKAVWDFIRGRKIDYCSLYDEGFERLGCVGCPLITPRQRAVQFERWPGYARAWRRVFSELWAARAGTLDRNGNEWFGSRHCDSDQDLFDWWNGGQLNIGEWLEKHRQEVPQWQRPTTDPSATCRSATTI
jgi:phosphoadenosine phosphosulfate reductase